MGEVSSGYIEVDCLYFFRYDGTNFNSSSSTTYTHQDVIGLGNYRGQPFTTGGSGNAYTEILTISTDIWTTGASYPFSSRLNWTQNIYLIRFLYFWFSISYYSTASVAGKVYIIGGLGSPDQSLIAEYSDDQWREYGFLSSGRYVHSSITHYSETMIIGAFSASAWVLIFQ